MIRQRVAFVVALAGLAGCREILGVQDRQYEPGDTSTSDTSSSDTSSDTSSDSASNGSSSSSTGGSGGAPLCTANLLEDAQNCGACFHDCLGGQCAKGACQPVHVGTVTNASDTHGLLVDSDPNGYVYTGTYRDVGAVSRLPKGGGFATTLYSMDADVGYSGEVAALATDGARLYFSDFTADAPPFDSRGFYAMNPDGTDVKPLALGYLGSSAVVPDGDWLYFMNDYDRLGIGRVPKLGGAVEPLLTLPDNVNYVLGGGLYVDSGWLYYGGAGVPARRMATDGTNQMDVGKTPGATVIGVHGGMLYWRDGGVSIVRAPIDGMGAPQNLVIGDGLPASFQGGYVYVKNGSTIARFKEADAHPTEELVVFGENPGPFVVDDKNIWWVEHWKGEVWRLAL